MRTNHGRELEPGCVYLLGPMTGIPDFNYPAFNAAAADLRELGYRVVNPTETDAAHDWTPGEHDPGALALEDYRRPLRWAVRALMADDVTGGVALPGWQASSGARLEALGLATLRLPILAYPDLTPIEPGEVAEAIWQAHGESAFRA